jgi:biopolymer transport protein TolR
MGMHSSKKRGGVVSEINVTPLVDVMLVLLVVFMVAAPLMTANVPVNLPESAASPSPNPDNPLVISLSHDGGIYVADSRVPMSRLVDKLSAISGERPNTVVFLRADKDLPYGTIMGIMGILNKAGFSKISLVSEAMPNQ